MRFSDFIANNHVFTAQSLRKKMSNGSSAQVALSRAVASGKVAKVRSGLYVSGSGRFQGVKADPHLVAATLRPGAVFVLHSALVLHGLAHSISNTIQCMTHTRFAPFSFDGVTFISMPFRERALTEALTASAYGAIRVTTREQTLVDCLATISSAGGTEEVLCSFSGLPYADVDTILTCLNAYPPSVASRVGWYLEMNQERWAVPDEVLSTIESKISRQASYKLDPKIKASEAYSARWRLSLPASVDTLSDWMGR